MNARDLGIDIAERNLHLLQLMQGKAQALNKDAESFANGASKIRIDAMLANGEWAPVEKDIKAAEEVFKTTGSSDDYLRYLRNLEIGFIYLRTKIDKKLNAKLAELNKKKPEKINLITLGQILSEAESGRIIIPEASKAHYQSDLIQLTAIEKLEEVINNADFKTRVQELPAADQKKYGERVNFMEVRILELALISKNLKSSEVKEAPATQSMLDPKKEALDRRKARAEQIAQRLNVRISSVADHEAKDDSGLSTFPVHTPRKDKEKSRGCFPFFQRLCCPNVTDDEDNAYTQLNAP
jgi:hypothetical protein